GPAVSRSARVELPWIMDALGTRVRRMDKMRRLAHLCLATLAGLVLWAGSAAPARAQDTSIGKFWYYPYYYFPHNYWPQNCPQWPDRPGMPYRRPPAYMTYPAFREPNWHYPLWGPYKYYRGFHFWLDQF